MSSPKYLYKKKTNKEADAPSHNRSSNACGTMNAFLQLCLTVTNCTNFGKSLLAIDNTPFQFASHYSKHLDS